MPLFRALAKNMAPMTNADESPTNRLTLFPVYLSLFIVSTLCQGADIYISTLILTVSKSVILWRLNFVYKVRFKFSKLI